MEGKKLIVIGTPEFCIGFKLIGIECLECSKNSKEFQSLLEDSLKNKNIGIVVVEKELLQNINWKIKKVVENSTNPVVVSFSLKEEEGEDLNYLIKKALGLEIKS